MRLKAKPDPASACPVAALAALEKPFGLLSPCRRGTVARLNRGLFDYGLAVSIMKKFGPAPVCFLYKQGIRKTP
jgi:hypothetical protein